MGEEIMKFKKIMFVGIVLLAIFAIGAVSASDVNDTAIASDDINANEEILTVNNEISDDKLVIEEINGDIAAIDEKANDDSSVLTVKNDEQLLSYDGPEKVKITVYKQTGDYATNKKLYFRATDSSNNPVYAPARNELNRHGISCEGKRAVRLKKSDYDYYDYLIGMDAQNIRNIERMTGHQGGKIHTLLEFCGSDASIADPWYTGDFERTYRDIIRGCTAFLDHLRTDGKIG